MSGQEAGEVLQEFKKLADEGKGLLVAPMGGRFAEGIDLPGKELVCVFLAGIPFEKPTVKTNLYISYYEELYGEGKGRLYAYIYPALRKASQAIGRALRSPRDQAVIILGDHRYNNYLSLLPDYVRELRQEISHTELDHIKPPWERIKL
jgi:Rad3-related DNA helicases